MFLKCVGKSMCIFEKYIFIVRSELKAEYVSVELDLDEKKKGSYITNILTAQRDIYYKHVVSVFDQLIAVFFRQSLLKFKFIQASTLTQNVTDPLGPLTPIGSTDPAKFLLDLQIWL